MVQETDKSKYTTVIIILVTAVIILLYLIFYQQRIHRLDMKMEQEKNESSH